MANRDFPESEREARERLEEIGLEQVRLSLQRNGLLPVNDLGIAWRWMRDKEVEIADRKWWFAFWTLVATVIGAVAAMVAAVASVWLLFR